MPKLLYSIFIYLDGVCHFIDVDMKPRPELDMDGSSVLPNCRERVPSALNPCVLQAGSRRLFLCSRIQLQP